MTQSKITILVANYNNTGYLLNGCLPSVMNQTSDRWNLILRDDNSPDCGVLFYNLNEFSGRFPKEHYRKMFFIPGTTTIGYTKSLINMIENEPFPQNEIIGILDADDALEPTAIQDVMEYYDAHPEAEFVYTNFWYCDHLLNKVKIGYCREIPDGRTALELDCVSHFKTFKMPAYRKCGGYDKSFIYAQDKDLIYKMEEVTKLHFINKALYLLRRGHKSAVNSDPLKRKTSKEFHDIARDDAIERRKLIKKGGE